MVIYLVEHCYIFDQKWLYFWLKMFFFGELYKILGKNVYILVSYILGLIYLWW